MIYIIYSNIVNYDLFKLWLIHYKNNLQLNYKIYINNPDDLNSFILNYPDHINRIINEKSSSSLVLTEYDFLFNYSQGQDDNMILTFNINANFINNSLIIGRLFYVPIQDKEKYTTFEIPDFILYKHANHTNYTINGLKTNQDNNNIISDNIICIISDDIICISMRESCISRPSEYYENNILFENNICDTIYTEWANNLYVNKEKMYGIIWHSKCACSSICNIFCNINNIQIDNSHNLAIYKKYRYNSYLQNIKVLAFIRNPYNRLLSSYFNRHIEKKDPEYISTCEYKQYINIVQDDSINNLVKYYLDGNVINETILASDEYCYKYIFANLDYIHIEDNFEFTLYNFLSNYHENNNIIYQIENTTIKSEIYNLDSNYKSYNYDNWIEYYKKNKQFPNYKSIIDDELKEILYQIYSQDIIKFNYDNDNINDINIDKKIENNLPQDFDSIIYQELNPDLKLLDDYSAKIHYINYKNIENRKYKYENIPDGFDSNIYLERNPDLINLNNTELKNHYENIGFSENRIYKYKNISNDFDSNIYLERNPDLIHLNNIELKNHYENIGFFENRIYK